MFSAFHSRSVCPDCLVVECDESLFLARTPWDYAGTGCWLQHMFGPGCAHYVF